MMLEELRERSRKELAQMAKAQRIRGWHLLKKEELICHLMTQGIGEAAVALPRKSQKKGQGDRSPSGSSGKLVQHDPARQEDHRPSRLRAGISHILTANSEQDALDLELLETHWFRLHWSLTTQTLERAEVSLGAEWPTVKPVLRLFEVDLEPTGTPQERQIQEVEISDRFREWYFPVPQPEARFRAKLGLLTHSGRFYQLACSDSVDTPSEVRVSSEVEAGPAAANGARNTNEGLKDLKSVAQLIKGRAAPDERVSVSCPFQIELELTMKGTADPRGQLTILGETVELESNGAFDVALPFVPGREVIPIVETTDEGRKKQTVVLSVELNRRELEPQIMGMMDSFDDDEY